MNAMLSKSGRYLLVFLILSTAMGGLFIVINLLAGLMSSGSADIFAVVNSDNQAIGIPSGSVIMAILLFTLGISLAVGAVFLIYR